MTRTSVSGDDTASPSTPLDVPVHTLPSINRRVLLTRRPAGIPQPEDFRIDAVPRPVPGDGQILVRNLYLSVDPAQRGWASAATNYSDPVALGQTMRALAVGVVIKSRNPAFAAGRYVYGWLDWQDYAVVDPSRVVMPVDHAVPLSAAAGLLGINGLTAHLALTELGRPSRGDTLLVSTAAGSVGGFVGQIGARLGCRTVGLTGGPEKVARCLARYGYDAAFDYRAGDLDAILAKAAPDGIDIYFDNVGGPILDAALRRMRTGGRVIQCGTASVAAWDPAPVGPRVEREILTRRLSWNGFVIFDHAARFAEAADRLASWWRDGSLRYDEDITTGIEAAPGALQSLYAGDNVGKRLIYVGGS